MCEGSFDSRNGFGDPLLGAVGRQRELPVHTIVGLLGTFDGFAGVEGVEGHAVRTRSSVARPEGAFVGLALGREVCSAVLELVVASDLACILDREECAGVLFGGLRGLAGLSGCGRGTSRRRRRCSGASRGRGCRRPCLGRAVVFDRRGLADRRYCDDETSGDGSRDYCSSDSHCMPPGHVGVGVIPQRGLRCFHLTRLIKYRNIFSSARNMV